MKIKTLCSKLNINTKYKNALKNALTHRSFFVEDKSAIGNSRYVFMGQYVFRAKLAEILLAYVSGTGMQLERTLHLLTASDFLKKNVYDHLELNHWVRLNPDYKRPLDHIFSFALLGFLTENMTERQLNDFMITHFIQKGEHIIYTEEQKSKDVKSQFTLLCKQFYNAKPKLEIIQKGTLYDAFIKIKDVSYISTTSNSKKYLPKKIMKLALKKIIKEIEEKRLANPEYRRKIKQQEQEELQKKQKERKAKLEAYFDARAKRGQEIKEAKEAKKLINREKDKKRRQAKQRAKERKELMEKQQRLQAMGLENISASKRRILEDKGILEKKK